MKLVVLAHKKRGSHVVFLFSPEYSHRERKTKGGEKDNTFTVVLILHSYTRLTRWKTRTDEQLLLEFTACIYVYMDKYLMVMVHSLKELLDWNTSVLEYQVFPRTIQK